MGHLRWTGRRPLDRKHEHRPRRQQDAVHGEQRAHQVHQLHAHDLRGGRPGSGESGHRQPLWHGLHRSGRSGLDALRQDLGWQGLPGPLRRDLHRIPHGALRQVHPGGHEFREQKVCARHAPGRLGQDLNALLTDRQLSDHW